MQSLQDTPRCVNPPYLGLLTQTKLTYNLSLAKTTHPMLFIPFNVRLTYLLTLTLCEVLPLLSVQRLRPGQELHQNTTIILPRQDPNESYGQPFRHLLPPIPKTVIAAVYTMASRDLYPQAQSRNGSVNIV